MAHDLLSRRKLLTAMGAVGGVAAFVPGFAMAQADAEREITDPDLIDIIHQVRRGETPRPANPGPATAAAR